MTHFIKNRVTRRFMLACSLLLEHHVVYALSFNTDFLAGGSDHSDLTRFYQNSDLPEGNYSVDIYVNNDWKGNYNVKLVTTNDDIRLNPDDFNRLGIKSHFDKDELKGNNYINLFKLPGGVKSSFDAGLMKVNISVPQQELNTKWQGYVDPKFWDEGIPGLTLSYQANYYHSTTHHQPDEDTAYVSLNSGLNLLNWQFRDNSAYNYSHRGKSSWVNNTRYLQRNFSGINSQLRIGDSYTTSDLFDSYRFRGVSIGTDIRMFPDSMQGFAPIVHGVAQTNALVKIIQNGVTIYQQNVSPGPFAINDILPTGSGGDLHVEVDEADGRIQRFIVPYSSVPGMLKEGVNVYNIAIGEVRIPDTSAHPNFVQGTWRRGMSNLFTVYGGAIWSSHYGSVLAGTGLNLPFGALSFDITEARQSSFHHLHSSSGQSYRLAYSKFFSDTGTNLALAAWRYSTSGFLTLEDSVQIQSSGGEQVYNSTINQKNSFNVNINQNLGGSAGSFFLSGTVRDYWNGQRKSREYQVGYSNTLYNITYNLSASRTRNNDNHEEMRYYLGLSIPFTMFDSPMYLSANSAFRGAHYTNSDLGLSGSAGQANQWNYNVNLTNNQGGKTTANTNASYRGSASTVSASWSQSSDFSQTGLGMTGSVVAYQGGVLFANQVGNTFAIVDAPGLANARVNSDGTILTNSKGRALVPYMSPYRKNALTIDTTGAEGDAQLLSNRKDVVPYSGSISWVKFDTDQRKSFIFYALDNHNGPLPFGTLVTDSQSNQIGYVGQGSVIFLQSEKLPDTVVVHFSGNTNHICTINNPKTNLSSDVNHCQ
ncbi:fimbria/pilus outer membrane usher protein [Erwinia sp. J316]|uniref:Fimbria/pilus outer membrane usher protein n=2 Tax=Erwinia sorbitola TaxID=2681984 RepID=A0ABW9RBM8_9GAMM|nr:fimbria/pilus outer membrane usher protein [Erwinia sorbitola]